MLGNSFSSLAISSPNLDAKRPALGLLDLPFELRYKILCHILITPHTIDLDPNNYRTGHQRLNLFLVSRTLYHEASNIFYSRHTFRVFPTHGRFFGHKTIPLPARLPSHYREALTSLELRLGPGWSNPPKSWKVDGRLGLEEMKNVRTVKVFVECDPSHDIFNGFRIGRDYFTEFAAQLLEGLIDRLPSLIAVEFDAWPSVMREGPLMKRLVGIAKACEKQTVEISIQQSFEKRMIVHMSRPRNVD